MPTSSPTATKGHIKIAAHVVIQLGQELVTDVEQAFLELAKNAYDADSANCVITIDPDWAVDLADPLYAKLDPAIVAAAPLGANKDLRRVGRVLITDTGVGASQSGVTEGWLTISASLKRAANGTKKETVRGRTPVGDKGLGRLATMKIGDLLLFRTAQAQESIERVASFSWSEFSRVRTVDQVTVEHRSLPRKQPYKAGTVVEIVGLHDRERWQRERSIDRLVARLSSLVNPYEEFKDFDIQLQQGKKVFELQRIGADVLNFAAAKFEFEWTGKKLAKRASIGKGLFRGAIGEEAREKFEMVFAPENEVLVKTKFKESRRLGKRGVNIDKPTKGWFVEYGEQDDAATLGTAAAHLPHADCGPFEGKIYYFMFNEEFNNKIQGNAASAEQVKDMSGILVFRDGFRVRIGDDWLNLSEGTTSGNFYNLRPKNTLGYFAVTNKSNPGLVEKSDREGFVDNRPLHQFMYMAEACKKYANDILHGVREDFNDLHRSLQIQTDHIATPRQAQFRLKETRKQASSELERMRHFTAQAALRLERAKVTLGDTHKAGREEVAVREMQAVLASFSELGSGLAEIQNRVADIYHASDAVDSFRKDEVGRNLRLLESAAVGLSARALAHELRSYIDQIDHAVREIAIQNKRLTDPVIADAVQTLVSTLRELRKAISSIDPLLPGSRSIKETLSLGAVVASYVSARDATTASRGVEVKVSGAETKTLFRFSRTRFYQVLENLLQNSLYWLQSDLQRGATSKRVIRVSVHDGGFDWWDSGPGVVERYEDSLFDPFVSSKPRGEGQGLGLYIVSTYLESERCSISLLPTRNAKRRRYKFRVDLSGASVEAK